ncbi:hypothetical protein HAX54_016328, partial [Datura stramonium]|nr:hypothetical protein [Datura stramonium]
GDNDPNLLDDRPGDAVPKGNGDDNHQPLTGQWFIDEFLVETSLPSVLLTVSGSLEVCRSPLAICRSSAGAARSFKLIPPLISHLIL